MWEGPSSTSTTCVRCDVLTQDVKIWEIFDRRETLLFLAGGPLTEAIETAEGCSALLTVYFPSDVDRSSLRLLRLRKRILSVVVANDDSPSFSFSVVPTDGVAMEETVADGVARGGAVGLSRREGACPFSPWTSDELACGFSAFTSWPFCCLG